jgi:anaerobic selenocysteine-containing dehydrogenase
MTLIVVDPRETPTTALADIHLPVRPGTDGALALSMANVIIHEKLYDRDFVDNHSYGFEEYREYDEHFTTEKGEELTECLLIRLSRPPGCMRRQTAIDSSASPVVHHTNGVQNYRAVFDLIGLTGIMTSSAATLLCRQAFCMLLA